MLPSLAIFAGDDVLKTETHTGLLRWQLVLLLAMPPLLVLGILVARAWWSRLPIGSLFHSSVEPCAGRIRKAEHPADIAQALHAFVTKRFQVSSSSVDGAAIVGALRAAGHRELAIRCERILQDCVHEEFSDGGRRGLNELKQESLKVLDELQAESRRVRPKPLTTSPKPKKLRRLSSLRSSTSVILTTATVIGALLASEKPVLAADGASESLPQATASAPLDALTEEHQKLLLAEAIDHYNKAQTAAAKDSADAKQEFADAAEKFELLRHSGVRNSRLFLNLGNAYLQSGQTGRAIANYRRSLQIDPTNQTAQANLTYAEGLVRTRRHNIASYNRGGLDQIGPDTFLRRTAGSLAMSTRKRCSQLMMLGVDHALDGDWLADSSHSLAYGSPWQVHLLCFSPSASLSHSLIRQESSRQSRGHR